MVTIVRRNRGVHLRGRRLELVGARDADFEPAIVKTVCRLIESSDAYGAGELAHASAGLLVAGDLCQRAAGVSG